MVAIMRLLSWPELLAFDGWTATRLHDKSSPSYSEAFKPITFLIQCHKHYKTVSHYFMQPQMWRMCNKNLLKYGQREAQPRCNWTHYSCCLLLQFHIAMIASDREIRQASHTACSLISCFLLTDLTETLQDVGESGLKSKG